MPIGFYMVENGPSRGKILNSPIGLQFLLSHEIQNSRTALLAAGLPKLVYIAYSGIMKFAYFVVIIIDSLIGQSEYE